MPNTHVCLISDQPIPNLLPLMMEQPAAAVFLVTEQKKEEAQRLRELVTKRLGTKVSEWLIPPYGVEGVTAVCEQLLREIGRDDLTLNVTGGTKVSALAAYETFYSADCRVIYVNTATNELLTLAPTEKHEPLPDLLDVPDYLAAYGLAIDRKSVV